MPRRSKRQKAFLAQLPGLLRANQIIDDLLANPAYDPFQKLELLKTRAINEKLIHKYTQKAVGEPRPRRKIKPKTVDDILGI